MASTAGAASRHARPPARATPAGRPGSRGNRWPEQARPDLEAARRLVMALDATTLAIQGPPGSGKTYSGARMICTLLAAGKRVGITGTSHKVIGNLLAERARAGRPRGSRRPADPARPSRTRSWPTTGSSARRTPTTSVIDSRTAARTSRPAPRGCGRRRRWRRGRRPVRRRGGPDLAGQRARDVAGDRQPRAARRPAAARSAATGNASARRRALGAGPRARRRGDDPAGSRAVPRADLAAAPGPCARSPPRCSTTTVSSRRRISSTSTCGRRAAHRRGRSAAAGGPDRRRRQRITDRGRRRRRSSPARSSGGLVDRRPGRAHAVAWDEVLIVAPYNAQVGAIQRLLPADARVGTVDKFQGQEAPISIYSMTTSHGGPRAARDGLPLQPQPAERRDVAGPLRGGRRRRRRTCGGCAPGRRRRCGWRTRFCRFVELAAPREAAAGRPLPPGRMRSTRS